MGAVVARGGVLVCPFITVGEAVGCVRGVDLLGGGDGALTVIAGKCVLGLEESIILSEMCWYKEVIYIY